VTAAAAVPPGALPGLLADIRSEIDHAAELVNAISNGVKAVLRALPSEAVGPVLAETVKLQRWFNEAIAEIGHALGNVGNPEVLRAAGAAWATDIGGTVSGLSGLATDNMTQADDRWTGVAADAYRNTLLPQRLALAEIKTTGDEIDAVLNDLANAVVNFAISVGLTVAGLVAGLAVASVSVPTVIAAPLAIAAGCGAVAAFSAGIIGLIESLKDIVSDANTRSAELERRLSNNTAFPHGAWPRSTTDMNDGSITDGDGTDWHIK
jgi:hypothetical protein